jgi:exosortase D (VPLPA-CTERM-specific)
MYRSKLVRKSPRLHFPRQAGEGGSVGVFWLGLAIAGIVAFFWGGFGSLIEAWSLPEYSHGPIIPVIAAWLILRELRTCTLEAERSHWPGLVVVVLGLGVGLVGNLAQIPDIIVYGLLIVIAGMILLIAGPRQGMRFWAGWVFLWFMLPLPNVVYWPLTTQLQLLASHVGVEIIQAMRIPVYLEGNIIDLGVYKLQVAEACSGLRYLFPLMSFGFLFAVLYQGPVWQRIFLFLSTIPITIAMNSFRIGVIGVLVNQFGSSQAEGFLHFFEGWIIFIACIALLYFEAFLLQRLRAKPQSVLASLDLQMGGIIRPLGRIRHVPGGAALVCAAVVVVLSGAAWQLMPAKAAQSIDRSSFAAFPMQIEDWKGSATFLDPVIQRVLGADDYIIADYSAPAAAAPVNLFVAYYRSQTDGSGIHSPEVCLPSGGWEVSRWTQREVTLGSAPQESFEVNRAIIQTGEHRQLVYYWFDQRGRRMTSDYSAKLYTVWDSIMQGRSDGALLRVLTPIQGSGGEAAADERLQEFLELALPILPEHVPQ